MPAGAVKPAVPTFVLPSQRQPFHGPRNLEPELSCNINAAGTVLIPVWSGFAGDLLRFAAMSAPDRALRPGGVPAGRLGAGPCLSIAAASL